MSTTAPSPTRSTRTRVAVAVAVVLVAITIAITTATASGRGVPARDSSSQQCRLYESDAASWGETGAHLPQGCTDGE